MNHRARAVTVTISEARVQLGRLIDCAQRGDAVVITRHGRSVARLVAAARAPRQLGSLRGKIRVAEDFDAPLPDDLLALF
jgi:prevent-host-death family protein